MIYDLIIQPETFPEEFSLFDIIVLYIHSNTSLISLSLIIVSVRVRIKRFMLCLIIIFYFLNSKTNVVTNLNLFNSVNKSTRLFLVANSISLICSSEQKEFKILTL